MVKCWGFILLFFSLSVQAQTTDAVTGSQNQTTYNDVSGTPYVIREWSEGVIRFSSGRVANQFKLKFDCIKNTLLLQFNGSSFATESKVKEFVIYTKNGKEKDSMLFRKGFPAGEKTNEETYYEVMSQGKYMLLCLHVKQINEEQQIASNMVYRRIRDEEWYYLLKDGKMIELPADKTGIVEKFPEQAELLRKFISEQQLKFRDKQDFKKFIEYYNTL